MLYLSPSSPIRLSPCMQKGIPATIRYCVGPSTPPMPFPTTRAPTLATTRCPCDKPKEIPDKWEVDILIDLIEVEVLAQPKLSPQWLRAAFHDAGTFDQTMPEGGANGCLLTHPPMQLVDIVRMICNTTTPLMNAFNTFHKQSTTQESVFEPTFTHP